MAERTSQERKLDERIEEMFEHCCRSMINAFIVIQLFYINRYSVSVSAQVKGGSKLEPNFRFGNLL